MSGLGWSSEKGACFTVGKRHCKYCEAKFDYGDTLFYKHVQDVHADELMMEAVDEVLKEDS